MLTIDYSGPNTGHEFIDFEDASIGWYDSLDVRMWKRIKSSYHVDESSSTIAIMQAIDAYDKSCLPERKLTYPEVFAPNGGERRIW